jgi:antitoxin component YwqK of YwqJK toxin-antitoxin module
MSAAIEQPIMAAAQPLALPEEDAADICCICCDVETPEALFINPGPCKCKGSIKYHLDCLLTAMKYSANCGACKTPFSDPEFIGMQKRDLKPEEEVILNTSGSYLQTRKPIVYYKTDEAGLEQGAAYVFVTYNLYDGFYYFATVNFLDGLIDGEVTVAADFVKSARLSTRKNIVFTVTGGDVAGPFTRYRTRASYYDREGDPQQVEERGTWLPGQKLAGFHELRDWVSTDYSSEFLIVERATYKEDGSGLADGEHMLRDKRDPSYLVFANYKNERLHGAWARYKNNRSGQGFVLEKRNYKNGRLHGLVRLYSPCFDKDGNDDHQLVAEATFRNGMQVGVQRAFLNGGLYEETTLAADGSGLLDGVCTYYADGALYQRANFKMGVLDGFLRFYDRRGVERVRILMKDGRPKEGGRATYFDDHGAVEEVREVEYGAFLADFLEEGAVVRQNATLADNSLSTDLWVELREPAPAPAIEEYEQDYDCFCGMCHRSRRRRYSDASYDTYDSIDRESYRYRTLRYR